MKNKKTIIIVSVVVILLIAVVGVWYFFLRGVSAERRLEKIRGGEETLNIVLISLDTTRADHIGCYGFDGVETPNIDYLAAKGTRFADCDATVPLTLPSHSTMFTGTYPPYHGVRANDMFLADAPNLTLAEILSENGYETAAFVSAYTLFEGTGIEQGFQTFNDETLPEKYWKDNVPLQRNADYAWGEAYNWLEDREADKPFFLFLHFYDAHAPYMPPPPYNMEYRNDLYTGEIAYMDYVLSNLIPALSQFGYSQNTMIILTGDHGELLGEHGEDEHGVFVYEPAIKVPLIFYCPGLIPGGRVEKTPVSLADITPTILDTLGIELPSHIQGGSLMPSLLEESAPESIIYSESLYMRRSYGWGSYYALEKDGYKFIDAPQPELYNLRTDPDELKNLVEKDVERATVMADELDKLVEGFATAEISEREETLPPQHLEMLASLGYIGGSDEGREIVDDTAPDLVDAKDRTEFINLMHRANAARIAGDMAKAIASFEKMFDYEADSAFVLSQLGKIYFQTGNYRKALEAYSQMQEERPNDWRIQKNLAGIYVQLKQFDKAEPLLHGLIEKDLPDKSLAAVYNDLGTLANNRNKNLASAIEYKEKAMELDPDTGKPCFDLAFICAEALELDKAEEYADLYIKRSPPTREAMIMMKLKEEIAMMRKRE